MDERNKLPQQDSSLVGRLIDILFGGMYSELLRQGKADQKSAHDMFVYLMKYLLPLIIFFLLVWLVAVVVDLIQ